MLNPIRHLTRRRRDHGPLGYDNGQDDPKPITLTVIARDGQYHTFRLGQGDGVGYAGIRIDVHDDHTITAEHYDE